MLPQITLRDILDFEKTYKGSEEERLDLLRLYSDCSGDMSRIMDAAMCAGPEDEPRIRIILQVTADRKQSGAYAFQSKTSV